jgi:mevalonate kinase
VSEELKGYSVPGKVILLGEYAVLTGLSAIVAAIPPRFQIRLGSSRQEVHPRSPLGRLQEWAIEKNWPALNFNFLDPYHGAGGFGASTAQFALAYMAYRQAMGDTVSAESLSWKSALALYRQLMADEPLIPSGADLVVQWQGGVIHFDPKGSFCSDVTENFDWSCLLVFSATQLPGRKVPTHEHLELLSKQGFPNQCAELLSQLSQITDQGALSIRGGNVEEFGKAIDAYAEVLYGANLEVAGAHEDRIALRTLPGVLGVKGAGALQSDALIIALEPGANRAEIIEGAQKRGLVLISNGIQIQSGVKLKT